MRNPSDFVGVVGLPDCAKWRNETEGTECTNIYLQKVQVTYDTGFLHTVV